MCTMDEKQAATAAGARAAWMLIRGYMMDAARKFQADADAAALRTACSATSAERSHHAHEARRLLVLSHAYASAAECLPELRIWLADAGPGVPYVMPPDLAARIDAAIEDLRRVHAERQN